MALSTAARKPILRVADIGLAPLVYPAGLLLKMIRNVGLTKMPSVAAC